MGIQGRPNGMVQIIAAIGSLMTTVGTIIVIVMTTWQAKTLVQVEQQGNSRELENKRLITMAYQRLAQETKKKEDIALYEDALKSYEAAKRALDRADER